MSFTAFSQPFKSPFEIARQNAFHFFLPRRPLPAALLSSPESPVERDSLPFHAIPGRDPYSLVVKGTLKAVKRVACIDVFAASR